MSTVFATGGGLISNPFQVLREEARRNAERDQLENAQMQLSLLSERLENAERENARLRAQVNVKG